MDPRNAVSGNFSLDELSHTYSVVEFLEAISEIALENIDEDVLGMDPRDMLIAFSFLVGLGLLGLVGNVFSVIVWSRRQLKSSSAILLIALAASDVCIIFGQVVWQFLALLVLNYRTPTLMYIYHNTFPYLVLVMINVFLIADTASVYLTVVITVERYIAVCHPFKYQELCSFSKAYMSTVAVIVFSILFNMIEFWAMEVQPHYHKESNETTYHIHDTELGADPQFKLIYEGYIFLIIMYILPLTSISLFNVAMCRQLTKKKQERELTDIQQKEKKLTLMLVYVIVEFAVCTAVVGFITFCIVLDVSRFDVGFDLFWCAPLMYFSRVLNSSINFVTYFSFGGPFRRTLLDMFGCRMDVREKQKRQSSFTQEATV
ncbi:hypothetical protein GE061_010607 [Apolygus lucorum]|uniref:G-protein coupled receptors family 1 profile domain-containing protein n=1 Tax=Apolygus lucorum TaxID=248454 RepID=A0A8S9XVD3_APOLU|nr:hypothetical protein GE061_010607 [Apolygus lucorum]